MLTRVPTGWPQPVCYNQVIGMPSTETDRSKLTVEELATRLRSEMVPVNNKFSYFTAMPIPEEDLKQYLQDPIATLPPAVCSMLQQVGLLLLLCLCEGN